MDSLRNLLRDPRRGRHESAAAELEPLLRAVSPRLPDGFPFRLRLWDGSELADGRATGDPLTLVARSPEALAHVLREPNQLGLGRAWVSGELDVEGDLEDNESLREHYALTLRCWLSNLANNREEAIAETGADRERIWRLYMTGAAQGFDRGDISVHQVLATAPGRPHRLPLARPASAQAAPTVTA